MANEVWMVEWSGDYSLCNAAFSTREKAIAHIESEARRMELYNRDFHLIAQENTKTGSHWGLYGFSPRDDWHETHANTVTYQCYVIDATIFVDK